MPKSAVVTLFIANVFYNQPEFQRAATAANTRRVGVIDVFAACCQISDGEPVRPDVRAVRLGLKETRERTEEERKLGTGGVRYARVRYLPLFLLRIPLR